MKKHSDGKRWVNMHNLENGGDAHEVKYTTKAGIVTFTEVPQDIQLKVMVWDAPEGGLPTTRNSKLADESTDSDLHKNGMTDAFYPKPDDTGVHSNIDLGYRMPETVIVKVGPCSAQCFACSQVVLRFLVLPLLSY